MQTSLFISGPIKKKYSFTWLLVSQCNGCSGTDMVCLIAPTVLLIFLSWAFTNFVDKDWVFFQSNMRKYSNIRLLFYSAGFPFLEKESHNLLVHFTSSFVFMVQTDISYFLICYISCLSLSATKETATNDTSDEICIMPMSGRHDFTVISIIYQQKIHDHKEKMKQLTPLNYKQMTPSKMWSNIILIGCIVKSRFIQKFDNIVWKASFNMLLSWYHWIWWGSLMKSWVFCCFCCCCFYLSFSWSLMDSDRTFYLIWYTTLVYYYIHQSKQNWSLLNQNFYCSSFFSSVFGIPFNQTPNFFKQVISFWLWYERKDITMIQPKRRKLPTDVSLCMQQLILAKVRQLVCASLNLSQIFGMFHISNSHKKEWFKSQRQAQDNEVNKWVIHCLRFCENPQCQLLCTKTLTWIVSWTNRIFLHWKLFVFVTIHECAYKYL